MSDEEIRDIKISELQTFAEVAYILKVSPLELRKILIVNKKNNYTRFEIPKRNGGSRVIDAPRLTLKIIQKRLVEFLNEFYQYHDCAHGSIPGRSVISNANKHLEKDYILSLDLKDFYPSIDYSRVYGLFKKYFKCNNSVAGTLANICCHPDSYLPQGAPTSPIISNMIAYSLDKKLYRFARSNSFTYTRYVDDITMSTNNKSKLNKIIDKQENDKIELTFRFAEIIKKSRFIINDSKTRLRGKHEHQSVTGIKVNQKLNVSRSYIRYIRALLHSLESNKKNNSIDIAENTFYEKYNFRFRLNSTPDIYSVIQGMISFVGQVRGREDHIYQTLAGRYNAIVSNTKYPIMKKVYNDRTVVEMNTFVIEQEEYFYKQEYFGEEKVITEQGTGFLLKGVGFITNAHVISAYITAFEQTKDIDPIIIHRSNFCENLYEANLINYSIEEDIAILDIKTLNYERYGLDFSLDSANKSKIRVCGFPHYQSGNDMSQIFGQITGTRISMPDKKPRIETDAMIRGGNSGGPTVNEVNQVIGIATKGRGEYPNEIIPIERVLMLNKKAHTDK